MNIIEKEMLNVLEILKKDFGVFEIKAEFEAEGSRMEEMMRLKDVVSSVGLPIILKTGGAEALTDMYNGLLIGVNGLIAPMIETRYAAYKYIGIINNMIQPDNRADIKFAMNIETETAYKNLDDILSLESINSLYGITLGRSDFVQSMGHNKDYVDSDEIFLIAKDIAQKVKSKGLKFAVGGNITKDSVDFIRKLYTSNLVDKYETRKVVFSANSVDSNPDEGIRKALEFELLWLKGKERFYSKIKEEDANRIMDLEKRLRK